MQRWPRRRPLQDSGELFEGEALKCWSASLRILSRGDKSESQLRTSLGSKGYPLEAIELTVVRLMELDYLNDQRFAEAYVRTHGSRLGISQLKRKLMERGVGEQLIEAAISEYAHGDQLGLAIQIAERRYSAMANLPQVTVERRICSFLLRRGFTSAIAWSAIRHLQQRN
jgi:regulatory protein